MYQNIKPYYDNDDISLRKEDYYDQVLRPNGRGMSPHCIHQFSQVPQPKNNNDITPKNITSKDINTNRISV